MTYRIIALLLNFAAIACMGWVMPDTGESLAIGFGLGLALAGSAATQGAGSFFGAKAAQTPKFNINKQFGTRFNPNSDPLVAASSLNALVRGGQAGLFGSGVLQQASPLQQMIQQINLDPSLTLGEKNKRIRRLVLIAQAQGFQIPGQQGGLPGGGLPGGGSLPGGIG